jgi:hypothetical protein
MTALMTAAGPSIHLPQCSIMPAIEAIAGMALPARHNSATRRAASGRTAPRPLAAPLIRARRERSPLAPKPHGRGWRGRSWAYFGLSLPGHHDNDDVFVLVDGVKIAKRGGPDTALAMTWIMLEPGWIVRDIDSRKVEVRFEGARIH